MRHAVDEVYDEFVAAETDKSVPRAMSTDLLTPASPFLGITRLLCATSVIGILASRGPPWRDFP